MKKKWTSWAGPSLFDYFKTKNWEAVQSSDIVASVRGAAKNIKLHEREIDPDLIGAQSLIEGGDMALKIMGYNNFTIIKCSS